MNRRSILKALFLGTPTSVPPVARELAIPDSSANDPGISDKRWHVPSGRNGRQELSPCKLTMNWKIENGRLTCMGHLPDTNAFLSDYRLSGEGKSFKAEMLFTFLGELMDQAKHELHVGFRVSPTEQSNDANIDAGVSRDGSLFIGQTKGDKVLNEGILAEPLRLVLTVISQSAGGCFAKLKALDRSGNTLATLSSTKYACSEWQGDIGVLSQYNGIKYDQPSAVISKFKIEGEKLIEIKAHDEHTDYIN
ncbi:MAG TPA: hypothetical protein VLZ28_00520 [Daejeonella sp.]|nr:hypothetical protein [Daejeonella sp.]